MGTEHSGVTDKPQTVFAGRLEAFGLALGEARDWLDNGTAQDTDR
jgi:hypothetical protein